ncbi:MAG: hypothetical protein IJ538_00130 [Clostridia bacterium]|nr:hypothetical protein [Clostridia bacterium]
MLDYSELIEKSRAYEIVKKDIAVNRCSHAYLFVSADRNYLSQFSEKFVCDLMLNGGADEFNTISRIHKKVHPDVMFFGEDEKLVVEVARQIIESSSVSPFEADKKVYVISHAEDMNESVQNAILKTIEEPPKNTIFVFNATSINRLLPTLLSRVKRVDLDELQVDDLIKLLTNSGTEFVNAEVCANLSNGNGLFAEKLAKEKGFLDFFENVVACVGQINGSKDVLNFSNKFTAKNVDKNEFLDILLLIFRDLNLILAGKEECVNLKNILPKLKLIATTLSLAGVTILTDECNKLKKELYANANEVIVVDSILFKLAEVKVKCKRSLL